MLHSKDTDPFTHALQLILDFVFPPSEDALLVRLLSAPELVALMARTKAEKEHALLPYSDRRVRACVHEAKFHNNKTAMRLLGIVLYEYLHTLPGETYVLIPIPLSSARFRDRGYNQVTEVAKVALCSLATEHFHPAISKGYGWVHRRDLPHITLREDVLVRTRHTKKQTDLPKEERAANVANAFACHSKFPHGPGVRKNTGTAETEIQGRHVILLDDVLTTGATMREAHGALKKLKPASIVCVALAH